MGDRSLARALGAERCTTDPIYSKLPLDQSEAFFPREALLAEGAVEGPQVLTAAGPSEEPLGPLSDIPLREPTPRQSVT